MAMSYSHYYLGTQVILNHAVQTQLGMTSSQLVQSATLLLHLSIQMLIHNAHHGGGRRQLLYALYGSLV